MNTNKDIKDAVILLLIGLRFTVTVLLRQSSQQATTSNATGTDGSFRRVIGSVTGHVKENAKAS